LPDVPGFLASQIEPAGVFHVRAAEGASQTGGIRRDRQQVHVVPIRQ